MTRLLIVSHGHPEVSAGGAELAAYALFREMRADPSLDCTFLAWAGDQAVRRGGTPFSTFRGRQDEILFTTDAFDHFLFSQPTDLVEQFATLLLRLQPEIIHLHHYSKIGLEFIALSRRLFPACRIIVTLHEYLAICNNYGQMIKNGTGVLCDQESPGDCHGCFKDVAPTEFLLRKLFIKSHFDKVDLFIAPSEFLRQRYIKWGLPPSMIVMLENGTEQRLASQEASARSQRSVFGFFGQINPYKGVLELLRAFDAIDHMGDAARGITLQIHGANLEMNHTHYVDQINGLLERLAARVHFAGPYRRSELGDLMSDVDWVVVPSIWWENSPLVIQEAFANRRPVLCSGIGGMAEKVRWGLDGFHFPAGNAIKLASLIMQVAGDPHVWNRLQQTIQRPVSISASARQHLRLYMERAFVDAD